MRSADLIYRRQFIMSKEELTSLSHWNRLELEGTGFKVYTHPDLDVAEARSQGRQAVLLGYIFDARTPHSDNDEILNAILTAGDFDRMVRATYRYAGRFVLIYRDGSSLKLLHDAGGLREVYYAVVNGEFWCGSQPSILSHFLNLAKSSDKTLLDFYISSRFGEREKMWAGSGTIYPQISHLMPNHYLDCLTGEPCRYWPDRPVQRVRVSDAAEIATGYLQGFITAASKRGPVMQAVTAGWDTRVLLAASKNESDHIYYFINKHGYLSDKSADIRVPQKLLDRLCLPFHIMEYPDSVDPQFKETFLNNVTLARETLLPAIYNIYYKRFPGWMNINGDTSGIARNYFEKGRKVDAYDLAQLVGYQGLEYPTQQYSRWLESTFRLARDCDIDILDLFYWEQKMANWGACAASESDIAIEEFSPFNSRDLLITLLGVSARYRDWHNCRLYQEMTHRMWKDALDAPVNPSARVLAIRVLKKTRTYGAAKRLQRYIRRRTFHAR